MRVCFSWGAVGACMVILSFSAACKKESNPKPSKKELPVVHAAHERHALNEVARTLRELAFDLPQASGTSATRATRMLAKLHTVPAADLPESLRPAWLEMTAVLEGVSASAPGGLPPVLRERGEAAAAALNTALAAQGLTEFRF